MTNIAWPALTLTGRTALLALLCILVVLPVSLIAWFGLTAGGGALWAHILEVRLLSHTLTTLLVLAAIVPIILIMAVPAAWLVSFYTFPGRRIIEWILILPLAMPGYVTAYAWAGLAGVSGPVQTALRHATGWSSRDYWFPDIHSVAGLAFVLSASLFPYVYMTVRAAFVTQSLATLEAARSLGMGDLALLRRVILPAAVPAIIAGLLLALLEAAADYGAANFLGIQTLGVGIVRTWNAFGEPAMAARLALVLIVMAFLFLIIARLLHGERGVQHTATRWTSPLRTPLSSVRAGFATAYCCMIFAVGFLLPCLWLVWLFFQTGMDQAEMVRPLAGSIILGLAGCGVTFLCAIVFMTATRYAPRFNLAGRLLALAGYATPGVVLGLGALLFLRAFGLTLAGPIAFALLLWIYAARFTAAGIEPLHSVLARVPRNLDFACKNLGSTGFDRLWRVDLPVLMPGALTAGLILFVETVKELPVTLMLRPPGWDTLAVRAHGYASDERLAQAAFPALLIVLIGLGPVVILSRRLTRSRRI